MLKILATIFCCTFLFWPLSSLAEEAPKERTFVVGFEKDFPPYSFLNAVGEADGFSIALIKTIAEQEGLYIRFQEASWDESLLALKQGEIDAISAIGYSEQRAKTLEFGTSYMDDDLALFRHKDAPSLASIDDLQGKRVLVQQDSIPHEYLRESVSGVELVTVKRWSEALLRIASGEDDYAMASKMTGLYFIKQLQLSDLEQVPLELESSGTTMRLSLAVKPGDRALLQQLNDGMAYVRGSGQFDSLYQQWLGELEPKTFDATKVLKITGIALVSGIGLFGLIFSWSLFLNRQVRLRTLSLEAEIHERKQAEGVITYQASHDSLTDLPNRRMFMQSLEQAIKQFHQHSGMVAVLFIGLDDFKLINDTLGYAAGNELLRKTAERLKSAAEGVDIIARQGGDEFMVLLAQYGQQVVKAEFQQEVAVVAQKILDELKKPFLDHGKDAYVSASIGISLFPGDMGDAEHLIQHAGSAMYRAKELGRDNYQFFSIELSERQHKKMSLATMLHKAIEQQEFRRHYQPLVDMNNGRMVGVEALIRWEREKGHLISPADFLPVAEETGMILPIGDWVAREACRQLHEWADKEIPLKIAINLSARQMWHGDIAHQILDIINEAGVSKHMLELEVTESAMIIDPKRMDKALAYFNENNINISLDDFGTDYSSLDRLKQLPLNKLKIDKSFIDGLPNDEDNMAIVTATINMARDLKLYSLAEGIETVEQYQLLKSLGCNYGQGYYFSKPVSAIEIERMFKQNHHWCLDAHRLNTSSAKGCRCEAGHLFK